VRVITRKRLVEFAPRHKDAKVPLDDWYRVARKADWKSFEDVRRTASNSVDQVGRYAVFNVGGNKFRLVVQIRFDWGKVFIKAVLTHKEYDRGDWKRDG
jgi:mRNA interferase HigB